MGLDNYEASDQAIGQEHGIKGKVAGNEWIGIRGIQARGRVKLSAEGWRPNTESNRREHSEDEIEAHNLAHEVNKLCLCLGRGAR